MKDNVKKYDPRNFKNWSNARAIQPPLYDETYLHTQFFFKDYLMHEIKISLNRTHLKMKTFHAKKIKNLSSIKLKLKTIKFIGKKVFIKIVFNLNVNLIFNKKFYWS